MPVLWSCPDPNCPPTAIVPVDVLECDEAAEAERTFTTDDVAALLNVPLDTIDEWHQEGTGLLVIRRTQGEPLPSGDVVRWLAEQRVLLATCQSDCGGICRVDAFMAVEVSRKLEPMTALWQVSRAPLPRPPDVLRHLVLSSHESYLNWVQILELRVS